MLTQRMQNAYEIECCIDSVESAVASEAGGAIRVELCSGLFDGGLTPSAGAIAVTRAAISIQLSVMIRPRGSDFCYSDYEFQSMVRDIDMAKDLGADCLVFGVLTPDGAVDTERVAALVERSRPCPVTFHRAFDVTRDPWEALEALIELGVDRILTSGQEDSVLEGAPLLASLREKANDRLSIMPGCGIHERNFERIHQMVGAREYHVAVNQWVESQMRHRNDAVFMGGILRPPEYSWQQTSSERVRRLTQG